MKLFINYILIVTLLFCACEAKKKEINLFTYNVQYVDFRWDEKKEMGSVDTNGAIEAFRSFPFKEQLEKANQMWKKDPDAKPTFPTISFISKGDNAALAIWSIEINKYEIYLEFENKKVTVEAKDKEFIVQAIKEFFSSSRLNLFQKLSKEPGAIIKTSFRDRINSIFA